MNAAQYTSEVEVVFSPTQIEKASRGERIWWWEYVIRRKPPRTKATDTGVVVAEVLEHYLKGSLTAFRIRQKAEEDPQGAHALVYPGLRLLPPPCSNILVEYKFDRVPMFDTVIGDVLYKVRFLGTMDLCSFNDPGHVRVIDHKTVKAPKWAKTASDLLENIQLNLYAWALRSMGACPPDAALSLTHNNFVKTGGHAPYAVTAETTWEQVDRVFSRAREVIERALALRAYPSVEDQDRVGCNTDACGDYGGCPHRGYCNPPAVDFRRVFGGGDSMSNGSDDLLARLGLAPPAGTTHTPPPQYAPSPPSLPPQLFQQVQQASTPPAQPPVELLPQAATSPFSGVLPPEASRPLPPPSVLPPPDALSPEVLQSLPIPPAASPFSGSPGAQAPLPEETDDASGPSRPLPPAIEQDMPLKDVRGLPSRLITAVAKRGVVWLGQLLDMGDEEIQKTPGVGEGTWKEAAPLVAFYRQQRSGLPPDATPLTQVSNALPQVSNALPQVSNALPQVSTSIDVSGTAPVSPLISATSSPTGGNKHITLYVDCVPVGTPVQDVDDLLHEVARNHPVFDDAGQPVDFRSLPFNAGYLHLSAAFREALRSVTHLTVSSGSKAYRTLRMEISEFVHTTVVSTRM